jgi:peptide chain release factor subunit 3
VEERLKAAAEYDSREHLNCVFIGHVDAGKSTLSGNILYLTGQVDQRTIEKFEREAKQRNRESWFLAFIMDTSEEERAKGKTVEVGRAYFGTETKRFTVLDAPGHKNYVPNMIQGAAQADLGVLVISARKGEFETGFERGGQTREHATLAKTLGVKQLIVAINKMDTCGWNKKRYDEIVEKLTPFLKQSGYNTKKYVTFLPLSGLSGANVKDRMGKDVCAWYDGPSLLETMDKLRVGGRDPAAPLRMPILDRYNERGTIALGKVESGMLAAGTKVMIMPIKKVAKVDSIFIDGEEVKAAKPGENVEVRLSGKDISDDDARRGFVLCGIDSTCHAVTEFDCQLMLMELDHRSLFSAGYEAVMHIHTAEEEVEAVKLWAEVDKKTGEKKRLRTPFVKSGAVAIVRLRIKSGMSTCIERFADYAQLGRFTLRDEGRTIAIGKVLKLVTDEK